MTTSSFTSYCISSAPNHWLWLWKSLIRRTSATTKHWTLDSGATTRAAFRREHRESRAAREQEERAAIRGPFP